MCASNLVNTPRATGFNVVFSLVDVDTIVIFGKTKAFEWRCLFFVDHQFFANAIANAFGSRF